jgi:hypothetical protein
MAMSEYRMVYLNDRRTIRLRLERETPEFVIGVQVKKDGDEFTRQGVDEVRHIIDVAAIRTVKRLDWNLIYAELQEMGE